MPSYSFRCTAGCRFDAHYPMAEAPGEVMCRYCGAPSRRIITAPHLSRASGSAYQLMERAARSAHEPDVVDHVPAAPGRRHQPVTADPLHRRLPRP